MGARVLILVRHGQYHPDPERLTEVGREQARLVAARLAQRGTIARLWCSTMPRAIETAQIVGEALGLKPTRRRELCERPMSTPPPASFPVDAPPHDPDGIAEVDRLVAKYFATPTHPGAEPRREIVVAHGNTIRLLTCSAMGLPPSLAYEQWLGHTGITQIAIAPTGRRVLVCVNDVGHLPPKLATM